MHGDVDPDYWEQEILPTLQGRVDRLDRGEVVLRRLLIFSSRFDSPTVMGSHAVDYDYNYFDGSPIIGAHPYISNMWMACGFNGLGAQMAPAVGRGLMELCFDDGYCTIDLSR